MSSKGGFFFEKDDCSDDVEGKEKIPLIRKEEIYISYPLEENELCSVCNDSFELDEDIKHDFKFNVCSGCKKNSGNRFQFITKTDVKKEYLLVDDDLNDENVLPHIEKPNPLKSHWNTMFLFLRYQVQEFAYKKWGSEFLLEQEKKNRREIILKRKEKNYKTKLRGIILIKIKF